MQAIDPGDKERLDRIVEDFMILNEKYGLHTQRMFMEAVILKAAPIHPVDMSEEDKSSLYGRIADYCTEMQPTVFQGAMEGVHNALFPFGHSSEEIDRCMPGGLVSPQLAAVNTLMAEDAAESWGSKDPHTNSQPPIDISTSWTPQERLELIALIAAGIRHSNMNRIPPIAGNAETIMVIATSTPEFLESQREHVEIGISILKERGIVPKTGDECVEEFRQMQNRYGLGL